jgi:hypothetical protein
MSILNEIIGKIFRSEAKATGPATASVSTAAPPPNTDSLNQAPPLAPAASGGSAPIAPRNVDVGAILDKAVSARSQKLNWKTSIVDLMKALDLDSSLQARHELARELHYTGDQNDSARMNSWLHGQLMKKLAENGGKLPEDVRT